MMLKVSGFPPEMTTTALRLMIQDSCDLSYVMVEESHQRDSSSGRSAVVACPDDHTGFTVLHKLHGMLVGPYQLRVESLTHDPTAIIHAHTTPVPQYESSNSKDYYDQSSNHNFQDSGQSSNHRNYLLETPNFGSHNSRQQQQFLHTRQDSDSDQLVTAVNPTSQKVSHQIQGQHGFLEAPQTSDIQKKLESVENFLQAAEQLLKVAPKILEISQSVQNSPFLMPGAQTNKGLSLATRVAQSTYQVANHVQAIRTTQRIHAACQNLNQSGSSHSASYSGTMKQSQLNTSKIHGKTNSSGDEKNDVTSTDESSVVNRAVDRVLYNLLNSKPRLKNSEKLEDQYANETYKSIIRKLRSKIRSRLNGIQSVYHSNSEKELYNIYCERFPDDIKGHLSQIGTGTQAVMGTESRKLLVELMLIETPWLQPSEVGNTPAQRQQFQRRSQLDVASNFVCLCVLNMPQAPTKNSSMPKLQLADSIVFSHFKVDIFKKLDEFCTKSNIKTLNSKKLAASFLLKRGETEIDKCLNDAISFCEKEQLSMPYLGIFKRSLKPNYRMFLSDKVVKGRAGTISREITRLNTAVIDAMKQASADKDKYDETLYKWVLCIVTKRMKDFVKEMTSCNLIDEYWKRYPNTKEVCVMADEQLKSEGSTCLRACTSSEADEQTFTSSIDEFLSEISEMVDSDG